MLNIVRIVRALAIGSIELGVIKSFRTLHHLLLLLAELHNIIASLIAIGG